MSIAVHLRYPHGGVVPQVVPFIPPAGNTWPADGDHQVAQAWHPAAADYWIVELEETPTPPEEGGEQTPQVLRLVYDRDRSAGPSPED